MRTDRRSFLRAVGGALTLALGRPALARGRSGALKVHRATRNTLSGAIGTRLRGLVAQPSSFKTYPSAEPIQLPPATTGSTLSLAQVVRGNAPVARVRAAPIDLTELGSLLQLTNGVTGRRGATLLRAAPSAGALYAGEIYVFAEKVSGLAPGAYYYAVPDRALLRLRSGSLAREVSRALERPGGIGDAAAIVLLTNVFNRYTVRYAHRGYRYALIDSGHIGENLRLGARALGLGERVVRRFHDDRLNSLLELDGWTEAVCALHLVGEPAEAAPRPSPRVRSFTEKGSPQAERLRGGAIERYHAATRLVEGVEASGPTPDAPGVPTSGRARLALPAPRSPGMSVDLSIRERRSAMRFGEEPVSLAELSFVLEMADGHASLERAPGVELYVTAHRVVGLAPGLYRYEPAGHRLAPLLRRDLSGAMRDACLGQEMAQTAAAGLAMVASIRSQEARAGTRSYRDLLLESGAMAQRVYLGAEALGLAARNLAAFVDDELNALLGLDGAEAAVIHLTMLGRGS